MDPITQSRVASPHPHLDPARSYYYFPKAFGSYQAFSAFSPNPSYSQTHQTSSKSPH